MAFPFGVVAYINGVRFDPSTVTYTCEDGGNYSFTIEVPAVPEWDILPERSHGVVFVSDPITKTWRFFCEGEYVSVSRSKVATGQRGRTLIFRSIFGWWSQASYTTMFSLASAQASGNQFLQQKTLANAFGKELTFPTNLQLDPTYRIESLQGIIQAATKGDASKTIPDFFPILLRNCALQTPVEAFYMATRRLNSKIHAFPDNEIVQVIGVKLFEDMLQNGLNSMGLRPGMTLDQILRDCEDMVFYQRKALPAPFRFRNKIMEFMWTPQLYTVMPPVCNVIFDNQVTSMNESRNFLAEPTRVIAKLTMPLLTGNDEIPFVYMANSVGAFNATALPTIGPDKGAKDPVIAMTHDGLSQEEMIKGVVGASVGIGLEKILNTTPQGNETLGQVSDRLQKFIAAACLHHFFVEKIKARTSSLGCVYLPYIVPGFPCLVEDKAGPYFGIVQSVTHILSSKSPPTTSISLSHVRACYIQMDNPRSPKNPPWLNKMYLPENVNSTYTDILGILPSSIGTGKNPMRSYTAINQGSGSDDQDESASRIVNVPSYDGNMDKVDDGDFNETVAARIATQQDPGLAAYQFQYREGMSLSEWASYHGLDVGEFKDEYKLNNDGLPKNLADGLNEMFASPNGMQFVGVGNGGNAQMNDPKASIFGIYRLEGGLSSKRQNAVKTIAEAIARTISPR